MQVLLTGGTGYIGARVLEALVAAGHGVTALVRSEASAARTAAAGATAVMGDLTDVRWLADQLREADGAVHLATPGDATDEAFDRGVVTAVATAYAGTGRPYVHSGGAWVWGRGTGLTEDAPLAPPALTAWRPGVEALAFGIEGARVAVVAPGIVHGHGQGIANVLTRAPRTPAGELLLVGDGSQHWTTVHVDDLADLYVRVLERGRHGAYYIGVSGVNPTVREIGEAAARASGAPGVRGESAEASRARLGGPFADALLLDQQATGERARTELGWQPSGPALLDEVAGGSYTGG